MTTDPLLNAALDRFAVPPPSANLTARIIAAAETREPVTSALPAAAPAATGAVHGCGRAIWCLGQLRSA